MSDEQAPKASVIRQWISVSGVSCDLRVGNGAIRSLGSILKGAVGHPTVCALVVEESVEASLAERVRRQLTDAGFEVRLVSVASDQPACTVEATGKLAADLCAAHITCDDLICAVGSTEVLSAVSYVAGSWCGGTPLALVASSLDAVIECLATPRGIDVAGVPEMLATRPCARYLIADLDVMDCDPAHEASILMRSLMAATALADGEKTVERLWDRSELMVAGDLETLAAQIADTAKSRGHIMGSTAISLRQTIGFGQTFMRAVAGLLGDGVARGLLLAEGIRFQARLAAGMELSSVDDVLTIDELLDMLELAPISCDVEPDALVEALKAERYLRSGRFLLGLPRKLGSVRLSSVDDELLAEHARAWCAVRAN